MKKDDQSEIESEEDTDAQVLERLEKINEKREELLKREEMMLARKQLSGKTEAGVPAEKPKEESDADYAKRLISKPYGDTKIETPE